MTLKGPRTKFENPVDVTQLPKEKLSLNWSVRRDPSFSITGELLFVAAIPFTPLLINLLIILVLLLSQLGGFPIFTLVFILLFAGMFLVTSIQQRHWCFIGCCGAIWLLYRFVPSLVAASSLISLIALVYAFRCHYVGYCCCTPVPRTVAENFRKTETVPPHIVPLPVVRDFWEAIKSWLSYNPAEHRLPGIWTSPAGSQFSRMILTVIVLTQLTVTLTSSLTMDHNERSFASAAVGNSIIHLSPMVILVGALYLGAQSILGNAGGLRHSATIANYWDELQHDLSTSPNTVERDSIFLGHVIADSSPVLLPLKTAGSHSWIVGATGAGKTAMLMFLIEQFILRGFSVAAFDLKADTFELWQTMQSMAIRSPSHPLPTWHFTNRNGWTTQFCSPFSQNCWKAMSPGERTNVILSGMGIGTKRDYGESWYSDATYSVLDFVNRKYPDVQSYRELSERISYELSHARPDELSKAVKRDGEQAALVIRRLAHVEMFNPDHHHPQAARDAGLDFGTLFNQQSLAYWGLNPLVAPIDSAEISRVVLGMLLATATSTSVKKRNLLLVVDEFQQMLAPGVLQLTLRQARSLGISVILLNQTVDDLKTGKNNFVPTVEGNTATQIWLNASGRDAIEQIQRLGGKSIDYVYTETVDGQGNRTRAKQEILVDRFDATTIAHASSQRNSFITRISASEGYAQYQGIPFVARTEYHLTHAEYQRRSKEKWPALSARSVIVGQRGLPPSGPSPVLKPTPPPSPSPVLNTRKSRNVISGSTIGKRTP